MSHLSGRTVDAIRQWLAALASGKPGFQRRREQDRTIYAIARALEPGDEDAVRLIALEGPTGIGKSIAYLIAGLVAAQRHGRTLIVSTATVALQQQLASDLDAIASPGTTHVRTAIVKGRGPRARPASRWDAGTVASSARRRLYDFTRIPWMDCALISSWAPPVRRCCWTRWSERRRS